MWVHILSQRTREALPLPRHHLQPKIQAYRLPLDDFLLEVFTQLNLTKADSDAADDRTNVK